MSYQNEYRESIENPEAFWSRQAELISWYEKPKSILSQDEKGFYHWFKGGKLNTSYLALDFHVENGRAEQAALIYDSPVTETVRSYTYRELLDEVARFAGMLQNQGVEKGDRVITSGLGGLFPKGILIGNIVEVKRQPHELFQTASIETAVDLSRMEEVFIIISGPYPQGSPLFTEK